MINQAITELYTDLVFIRVCKKYGKENHEELRSEVITILLEMPGEKQTTAVQWLINKMSFVEKVYYKNEIEKAKKIERQQIEDAHIRGVEEGYHFEGSRSDYEAEGTHKYLAEKYFNEIFTQQQ